MIELKNMINKTHIGAYGIVTKGDEILLIKKARGPYTGLLDLPGGSLEHGERIEEALIREIKEETGFEIREMSWAGNHTIVVDFEDERGKISMYHIGLLYKILDETDGTPIKKMSEEDSLGADWYAITDLEDGQMSPFAKLAVTQLK